MAPTEAAATPLPRDETTPPVMKMYLVAMGPRAPRGPVVTAMPRAASGAHRPLGVTPFCGARHPFYRGGGTCKVLAALPRVGPTFPAPAWRLRRRDRPGGRALRLPGGGGVRVATPPVHAATAAGEQGGGHRARGARLGALLQR